MSIAPNQTAALNPVVNISWESIEQAVDRIAQTIKHSERIPEQIVAVSRGGAIPATMLAHRLGIRKMSLIGAESYSGDPEHSHYPVKLWGISPTFNNHRTLIVDDIYDTGNTLRRIHTLLPWADYACLVTKGAGRNLAKGEVIHMTGLTVSLDEWAIFPWEG